MIFVFADSIFHIFRQPLTFGVSTVPKMEKEQQKDAPVTHNNVHKDWILVLAILHEKELAWVDGDNDELDLTNERMKNIIQIWSVTLEQLFNPFFACLCLKTVQPRSRLLWVGNFIFQSSLQESDSRWNGVKIQMRMCNHYSVLPKCSLLKALCKFPWSCAVQQPFHIQRTIRAGFLWLIKCTQDHYLMA